MTGDSAGVVWDLAAPGMVDRIQIAALMSDALGRPVQAAEIPVAEWLASNPLPPGPLRDGLATMSRHYDQHGFPGGNSLVLRAVLGREPRTLAQYINELAEVNR